MNPAPRTTQEEWEEWEGQWIVRADLARELETELTELKSEFCKLGLETAADAQDRIAELERAVTEQCLLNGKGSEREYALLGKVARLEAEVERLTDAAMKEARK
jgi:hypothetical protein